ncbi:hypothetical protein AZE42_01106 [Rhizopogon vesiculosus]|uniref:Radical SAM core domain-containing protein n=1 Tax=Rhizopogon vesiculosus TaxID=180088 RepID=A0A1J8QE03_9AGAM|nr:hypothetical protein AZE42_01106 [Rhizopogon vesiculosus]
MNYQRARCIRLIPHSNRHVSLRHHSQRTVKTAEKAKAQIALIDAQRPFSPALVDSFQRKHDYLRISLTERCNLRCFYCMPSEGVELSPASHILTDDEVIRLATLFVSSGVTKIRLTGGRLNELRPLGLESIGMTTNGLALHRRLNSYVENGLTHLNLSLDTLDPFKFEIMTRRPGHDAVLRSLDAALNSPGLRSVKLNVVVIKGLNDSEVLDFVKLTADRNISVRFIEFMPFTGNKWDKAKMIPSSQLLDQISRKYPNITRAPDELNDTARSWRIPGHVGSIGFISSMSDHFCSSCNRLRLTADGQIKVCLFDAKEVSLRDEMRRGVSDANLQDLIGQAVQGKQEKHAGMEDINVTTNRPMILIGDTQPRMSRVRSLPRLTTRGFLLDDQMLPHIHRRWSSSSSQSDPHLTHIGSDGRPCMVDVSSKGVTKRSATASGRIYIPKSAYDLITGSDDAYDADEAFQKARSKGDVLTVAQLAAIMGCKRTPDLIPLCHPLQISNVSVILTPEHDMRQVSPPSDQNGLVYSVKCAATVTCEGKTGVEMEALTAVSVGLLTVWDMLKAVAGKEMTIGEVMVTHKTGGKSGDFTRL